MAISKSIGVFKKKAGLYARVSTDIQMEGYSIDAQKEILLNYAKSKEYDDFQFYIDGGFSGKNLDRPAMKKMIKDIKEHKIDTVIVLKLDRISRSQRDTIFLIEDIFEKNNVGFISVQENFDTTSPFGKAMIGILSVFAQLERETILMRTRLGIKKRAENGYWKGGGKIPFPYRYDKEQGILVPIPEQVEILHKMISLYLCGNSFNKIGQIVGMDDRQVEKRILSITNTGMIPYKGEIYEGKHEAVVSKKLYDEIIRVNKLRSREKYEKHYLLSGKIVCVHCKAKYRYQKWGKRLIVYCNSQQKSKKRYIKDPNCKNMRWDSFKIEDLVLENIFKMSLDESIFKNTYNITAIDMMKELENRLNKINKQVKNLISFISDGVAIEETKEKIKILEDERNNIMNKIKDSNNEVKRNKVMYKMRKNLSSTWNNMTFLEKRNIVDHLIDRIEIDNNSVSIYYNIY